MFTATGLKRRSIPDLTLFVLYITFFTGFIFSFRAVSSISLGLLVLTGFARNKLAYGGYFFMNCRSLFFSGCLLLYLLQILALLFTGNRTEGWQAVQLKSALLFVPLAVAGTDFITDSRRRKLLSAYCIILMMAAIYFLYAALQRYSGSHDALNFFFYKLVSPVSHHPIYFSILVCAALVFLLESFREKLYLFGKVFHCLSILFLSGFLFLLSSRFVLVFYALYLVLFSLVFINNRIMKWGFIALVFLSGTVALTTNNPVSRKFYDLADNNLSLLKRDSFDPGIYFNGIQFRLLQWQLVPEILTENNSWITGVSPGDAQSLLDKKYIEKNLYTGDPERGDRGYLGYNTHNQFLQTLLQNGISGLLALLLIFIALVKMIWRKKDKMMTIITLLLLFYSCIESLFETQYGLLLFLFFPLFLSSRAQPEIS